MKENQTYTLTVCLGGRCFQGGGEKILKALEDKLALQEGQTSADGRFHLEVVHCMNRCPLGPNIAINGEKHHDMSPHKALALIEKLKDPQPSPLEIHGLCPFCKTSLLSSHLSKALEIQGSYQGEKKIFSFSIYPGKVEFQEEPSVKTRWACPSCSMAILDGSVFCRYCQGGVVLLETKEGRNFWFCSDPSCGKWGWES